VRDTEFVTVPDRLLEGDALTLGEAVFVTVFSELLDCVELADTLLELDTVEVCDIFCVIVPCDDGVYTTVIVMDPLAETEPDSE
jgi:hypothetical protein